MQKTGDVGIGRVFTTACFGLFSRLLKKPGLIINRLQLKKFRRFFCAFFLSAFRLLLPRDLLYTLSWGSRDIGCKLHVTSWKFSSFKIAGFVSLFTKLFPEMFELLIVICYLRLTFNHYNGMNIVRTSIEGNVEGLTKTTCGK